jgi:cellulose biosynthesis protein BcsQ
MGKVVTVFCEKGGAGKTTVTLILAHGLAAISNETVLLIDLDETPRLSEAIIGRERFMRDVPGPTRVSSFIYRILFEGSANQMSFIRQWEGFIKTISGARAPISIVAGDRDLQHCEDLAISELLQGRKVGSNTAAERATAGAVAKMVELVRTDFEYVLIDTPPRMTRYLRGALDASDIVLVPYEPGRGADTILNDTAMRVHNVESVAELQRIALEDRRYAAMPNAVKAAVAYGHRSVIDDLTGEHPHIACEIAEKPVFADLVGSSVSGIPVAIKDRYGTAFTSVRKTCQAVDAYVHRKTTREAAA